MDETKRPETGAQPAKSPNGTTSTASENENSLEALRAKTARLKALRLARDAATPQVAPKRKAAGRSKGGASSKRPAGTLSDWLNEQAKEGRRS
jgi:hypothetical protein